MKNKGNIFVAADLGGSKLSVMAASKNAEGLLQILAMESITLPYESIQYGVIKKSKVVASNLNVLLEKLQKTIQQKTQNTLSEIKSFYIGIDGNTLRTESRTFQQTFAKKIAFSEKLLEDLIKKTKQKLSEGGVFSSENFPQNVNSNTEKFVYEILPQTYSLDNILCENPFGKIFTSLKISALLVESRLNLFTGFADIEKELNRFSFRKQLSGVSLANAFLSETEKKQGAVLLDFGAQCTTIVVYKNGVIRYLSCVPLGGDIITKDLSDLTASDKQKAETIKRQYGSVLYNNSETFLETGSGTLQYRKMVSVIRARQLEIIDFVEQHLENIGYADLLKQTVVLTGGASKMKDLDVLLQQEKLWNVRTINLNSMVENQTGEEYLLPENALLVSLLVNATKSCCGSIEQSKNSKQPNKEGFVNILFKIFDDEE